MVGRVVAVSVPETRNVSAAEAEREAEREVEGEVEGEGEAAGVRVVVVVDVIAVVVVANKGGVDIMDNGRKRWMKPDESERLLDPMAILAALATAPVDV